MKKILPLTIAAMIIVLPFSKSMAEPKTMRVVTEGAYAPWNFSAADGSLKGFEIDLIHDLCARMQYKCEITAQDWDGMVPALNAGKFDVIMAAMSVTEERKKTVAFSDIYAPTSSTFITAKTNDIANLPKRNTLINLDKDGKIKDQTIEELRKLLHGKTIGVQGSTTNTNFLDKYLRDVAEIREYKTTQAHDLDLASGRIDAVFATITVAKTALEKPNLTEFTTAGPIFSAGVFGPGVAAAMRPDDVELRNDFNAALNSINTDGTMAKLTTKWFGVDLTPH